MAMLCAGIGGGGGNRAGGVGDEDPLEPLPQVAARPQEVVSQNSPTQPACSHRQVARKQGQTTLKGLGLPTRPFSSDGWRSPVRFHQTGGGARSGFHQDGSETRPTRSHIYFSAVTVTILVCV